MPAPMGHARVISVLDLSLTTPVRARKVLDRWSASTAEKYADGWGKFRAWAAGEGWTAIPATSETLALYAGHLAQQGKAPATIKREIASVRAWHRLHGQPVPDGVPALAVLQDHQASLARAGWKPRRVDALQLGEAINILASLDRATVRGRRDACVLLLAYAGMLTGKQLVSIRLRQISIGRSGVSIVQVPHHRTGIPDRDVTVPHWTIAGEHRPELCPVEAAAEWIRYLKERGEGGAAWLVRGIDRNGNVGGIDRCAGGMPDDGRMNEASLWDVLLAMLVRAGVTDPGRFQFRSLRIAGIVRNRVNGLPIDQLADEAGLSTNSATLTGYLIRAERLQIEAATRPDRPVI